MNKDKPYIIFVHGAGGSEKSWINQKEAFKHKYPCMLIELPGHGIRKNEPGYDTIDGYSEWLNNQLKGSGVPSNNFVLVGHSMGGAITIDYTVKGYDPKPRGLVLVATGARLPVNPKLLEGLKSNFDKTVEKIVQWAFSDKPYTDKLKEESLKLLKSNLPEVLYGDFKACDLFDSSDKLSYIKVPTLIVCGTDDLMTPVSYSEYLKNKIPNAELSLLKGTGHMLFLEKPKEFNMLLDQFINKLFNKNHYRFEQKFF